MTYIATPVIQDSEVLNSIARDLLFKEDEQIKLKRYFKVVTEDGVIHEITFNQLDGIINILDSTREVPPITPLQYLVAQYDLKDLVELGEQEWVVPRYRIVLMSDTKTIRLEGLLTKFGHTDKEFTFALGGFDFLQQLSLARCIALLDTKFADMVGTFDVSYLFEFSPEGISISSHIGV